MCPESRSPSEFRESTRAPLQVPATLQLDAFSDPLSGFTANVSQGGMFVQMDDLPPVGSIVKFHLDMTSPLQAIRGTAEVVWMRTESKGPESPAGVGLQFRFIEDEATAVLTAAVRKVLADLGPEPEQPEPPRRPRKPARPRPSAVERPAGKAKKKPAKAKSKKPKKDPKKKPVDDDKQILGMPAEKAKLILLIVLMAIFLISFLL